MVQPAGSDNGFQEWQEARNIIGRFDNNLHDLRKYGFSFITALLTANAILTSTLSSSAPGYVKLGIMLVTLGLFVTLRQLDQHYRLFQGAAVRRSLILERRLNVELTGEITNYYGLASPKVQWWRNVDRFYNGFLTLTTALGFAILYDGSDLFASIVEIVVLAAGALVARYLIYRISKQTLPEVEDWTIDKKVVRNGEIMRIGWTRFGSAGHGRQTLAAPTAPLQLSWEIIESQSGSVVKTDGATINVSSVNDHEREWQWSVNVPDGLYEFWANKVKCFTIQVVP